MMVGTVKKHFFSKYGFQLIVCLVFFCAVQPVRCEEHGHSEHSEHSEHVEEHGHSEHSEHSEHVEEHGHSEHGKHSEHVEEHGHSEHSEHSEHVEEQGHSEHGKHSEHVEEQGHSEHGEHGEHAQGHEGSMGMNAIHWILVVSLLFVAVNALVEKLVKEDEPETMRAYGTLVLLVIILFIFEQFPGIAHYHDSASMGFLKFVIKMFAGLCLTILGILGMHEHHEDDEHGHSAAQH